VIHNSESEASSPLVSLLILHLNGLEDTCSCLRSAANEGYTHKEILLLDNGSDPSEYKELQRLYASSLILLRNERNRGFAAGNNQLAKFASGKYLLLLNNDTEVTPGCLHTLVSFMEAHDNVAVCQPKIRSLMHRNQFDYAGACGGFLDRFGYPFTRGRVFETVEVDTGQYDAPVEIHWASGACFLIRTEVWKQEGGFDERFFSYMEEIDLCCRLRRSGHSVMSIPSALVYHKGGQVWGKRPFTKRFHEHRNNLLMVLKNVPDTQLVTRLPLRLLLEFLSVPYYVCRGELRCACAVLCTLGAFTVLMPLHLFQRQKRAFVLHTGRVCIVFDYFFRRRKTFASITQDGLE